MADQYDVFISYSRKDTAIADQICAAMDKEGITYFIDRQGIAGGMEFYSVIARAICASTVFLFLASEHSYKSKFTLNEINYAFNKKERNRILLPYIIDESKLPEDLELAFASVNWRVRKDAPIETVLMSDLLILLGRERKKIETEKKKTFVEERLTTNNITKDKSLCVVLPGGVKLDMIWIESGTFMMGSPEYELGRDREEETQHKVTLKKGYWLGKYPVTQSQYEAIMKNNPSLYSPAGGYSVGDNYPVYNVSWYKAKEFCEKLTVIEKSASRLPKGYKYTLPTEAQWEYACRAGTTSALNSGKDLTNEEECSYVDEVGWYEYNSNHPVVGCHCQPVGQKKPNAWGLYDMHGNVYEWCLDGYRDYPTSAEIDPMGSTTMGSSIVRGGYCGSSASDCRSAFRLVGVKSAEEEFGSGFRLALSSVQ